MRCKLECQQLENAAIIPFLNISKQYRKLTLTFYFIYGFLSVCTALTV